MSVPLVVKLHTLLSSYTLNPPEHAVLVDDSCQAVKINLAGRAVKKSCHKSCFKCSHRGCTTSPYSYTALEGILYCKHHFSHLFKKKGSYSHLIKCASVKRAEAQTTLDAQEVYAATDASS